MFHALQDFRQQLYAQLKRSKAALFDLMDAVLSTPSSPSLAQISLSPLFRRRWSSVYKAISHFRLSPTKLQRFLIPYMPQNSTEPLLLVLDHTAWPRLYAPTIRDRTFEHQPTVISGNKPITLGQGYSTLAVIPEGPGSWALPLSHERISSFETPLKRGLFQVRQASRLLQRRFVLLADSEYATAAYLQQSADINGELLLRLRPNRVLYKQPPAYGGRGRPRLHGESFSLQQDTSWGVADRTETVQDEKAGELQLRLWNNLHFRQAPDSDFSVLQVQSLQQPEQAPLWLLWRGERPDSLEQLWGWYQRRFNIEHWNRLAKQRLHWTLPELGSTQQGERWSRLVVIMTWQLWLARDGGEEVRLPWQKAETQPGPGRVAQGFSQILGRIGTPAHEVKPSGKGYGCPVGEKRRQKQPYPSIKKRGSRRRRAR